VNVELERRAEIITFYSYKGGTGRSMLLANVAWLLASSGKRVLTVDWDLEAPGLHRYFHPFLRAGELESAPGVIDLMSAFASAAVAPVPEGEPPPAADWYKRYADILPYVVPLNWRFESGGVLDFIPAGRFGDSYAERVAAFDWQELYERKGGGDFMEAVKESMRDEYDVVLIDSRTGLSDTAGLCTVQLPDKLVVCFTFNHQSVEGAAGVARSVLEQRGDRHLEIYPVALRVEDGERDKLDRSRRFARGQFADTVARLELDDTAGYWQDCEIPHKVGYAYEEILAAFGDGQSSVGSMLAAVERVVGRVMAEGVPRWARVPDEERRRVLRAFEMRPAATPEREYDVFISYSQDAAEYAASLASRLSGRYLRTWLDHSELVPGDDTAAATEKALARSLSLVAVMGSPDAAAPEEVAQYVAAKASLPGPRPVIPVLLGGGRATAPELARLTSIDAGALPIERVAEEIDRALGRSPAALRPPGKVESRPIEPAPPGAAPVQTMAAQGTGASAIVPAPLAPPARTSRRGLAALGVAIAGVALVATGALLTTRSCGSAPARVGGKEPTPTKKAADQDGAPSVTSEESEQTKLLLAAARATKDPLQRALLLREIPEAAFPPEDAQLLLQDAHVPAAVFRGKYTDARFDTAGARLVLSSAAGATIVATDGRTPPVAFAASTPPLRFAALAHDVLVTSDGGGVSLWKAGGAAPSPSVLDNVRDVALVAERDDDADHVLIVGAPAGGKGTRNAIFELDLRGGTAKRWIDLRDPVLALGFDPRGEIVYVLASGMYSLAKPGQPVAVQGLDAVPRNGAPVAVVGSHWTALADLDTGIYSAMPTDKNQPVGRNGRRDGLAGLAADTRFALSTQDAVTAFDDIVNPRSPNEKVGGYQSYAPSAGRPTSIATAGEWLLAGSSAGTVDLWKIGAGSSIPATLAPASDVSIVKVALSRDGRRALALSSDGTVRTWDVDTAASLEGLAPADVHHRLRTLTAACLAPEERATLLGENARTANEAYTRCVVDTTGAPPAAAVQSGGTPNSKPPERRPPNAMPPDQMD
jgi:hypothetical protein